MWLQQLEVEGFRCFDAAILRLSQHVNVICGSNGSGKTSFLEAVYLLGSGRSFRTGDPDQAIKDGSSEFFIRGVLIQGDGVAVRIGLRRTRGRTLIKFNQQNLKAATELTRLLPVFVITPDTHVEMLGSPKARRRWLDITLFHVKQGFLEHWKRYMRGIKHRNILLRRRASDEDLEAWDAEISRSGLELHRVRLSILDELSSISRSLLEVIFPGSINSMVYQQGWSAEMELLSALRSSRDSDRQLGTTRTGPHRSDVSLMMDGKAIATRLSRGQLKQWIATLSLAQAMVVARRAGTAPILLVDDLVSDLDARARERFLDLLTQCGGQLLFTTTELENFPIPRQVPRSVFHVKQGQVVLNG